MFSKWLMSGMIVLMGFVSGCETTKGFKEDVQNTWHNAQGLDAWIKENLW